ncbi:MFS transporter [Aeromonas cavernicola]|uniref:MFS transporter n=1 Tax=Aeromonas cavernicola TaxID=1006623 RepID=A0A2H9U6S2_9GAMM|nr:MFS transporter [Aeromonas cavernicola]PJG59689.1 MFS transporter [Aeromonas cavernicola]
MQPQHTSTAPPQTPWKVITAASIGNALEWFDLVVYASFATIIGKLFFPSENDYVALLTVFLTFGLSYIVRPLGGIVLGIYSDRHGRKAGMTLSIALMTVGTFMIAFMPTFAQIGVYATAGIVIARLIQGFSAGGEFGSSTAYLAEQNRKRRGFFASWQIASQGLTVVLASAFGAVLTSQLTPEQLESWGWRIPFIFGLSIGPVAYYIRTHLHESSEFTAEKVEDNPLVSTVKNQKSQVLIALGLVVLATVSNYLILYMPTYAKRELAIPQELAFIATLVTGSLQFIFSPIFGHLSDRIGRLKIMTTAAFLFLILGYPMFAWLTYSPQFSTLLMVQSAMGILLAAYFGCLPALMTELFPAQVRTTGMALSYNLSVTFFGSFALVIITWLIQVTGSKLAPSFYWMFAATISLSTLLVLARILRKRPEMLRHMST